MNEHDKIKNEEVLKKLNSMDWSKILEESKNMQGPLQYFDNSFMAAYKLNDEQYDFIAEKATDDELNLLLIEGIPTFAEKRQIVSIIKKYKALHANNSSEFDF